MQIEGADIKGTTLMLKIAPETIGEARRYVFHFKAGGYEIKRASKKRSLDANALLWHLCSEIADAIGESKDYVYRRAIREGNVYEYIELRPDAVQRFCNLWESRGKGWLVDVVDEGEKSVGLLVYKGTSEYNTKEMSALIDRLMQDADALGIDCLTERERSLLASL